MKTTQYIRKIKSASLLIHNHILTKCDTLIMARNIYKYHLKITVSKKKNCSATCNHSARITEPTSSCYVAIANFQESRLEIMCGAQYHWLHPKEPLFDDTVS